MNDEKKPDNAGLYLLLQLEAMARNAESVEALRFFIVNESRRLINYRQAFLFSAKGLSKKKYKVEAASSISVIDHHTPFIVWLTKVVSTLSKSKNLSSIQQMDANSCPEQYKEDWAEYSLPFVLWSPLSLPDGTVIGGIWFARETPWQENETVLIKRLSDSYAHAWGALAGKKYFFKRAGLSRYLPWCILIALILIFLIPVRMSALAPVEIVASDPLIVSAPIDGVIKEVIKEPNSLVKEDETLFIYEDTNLRNKYEIAEKSLAVTLAEFRKASQAAFGDRKSKSEIALLKSQAELGQSELDYAKELLNRVEVKASKSGLLIYADKDDWNGKPVRVGERIMEIADPKKIKLKVELAVDDAIVLEEGAKVEVFLDVSPLESLPAKITHTTYNAVISANQILSYKLDAELIGQKNDLRIGLQGTAKIYGNTTSLFFYLFRRPISSLRQMIGL